MPLYQYIPPSLPDVFSWAQVERNEDRSNAQRRLILAHKLTGPNGRTAQMEVVLHLQGFVLSRNLRKYGNWNEKYVIYLLLWIKVVDLDIRSGAAGAKDARQILFLGHASDIAPFTCQVEALNHLLMVIEQCVGVPLVTLHFGRKSIKLYQTVFTKVSQLF